MRKNKSKRRFLEKEEHSLINNNSLNQTQNKTKSNNMSTIISDTNSVNIKSRIGTGIINFHNNLTDGNYSNKYVKKISTSPEAKELSNNLNNKVILSNKRTKLSSSILEDNEQNLSKLIKESNNKNLSISVKNININVANSITNPNKENNNNSNNSDNSNNLKNLNSLNNLNKNSNQNLNIIKDERKFSILDIGVLGPLVEELRGK
jgi:hypothetical protein